jgi:hypothetical protein
MISVFCKNRDFCFMGLSVIQFHGRQHKRPPLALDDRRTVRLVALNVAVLHVWPNLPHDQARGFAVGTDADFLRECDDEHNGGRREEDAAECEADQDGLHAGALSACSQSGLHNIHGGRLQSQPLGL